MNDGNVRAVGDAGFGKRKRWPMWLAAAFVFAINAVLWVRLNSQTDETKRALVAMQTQLQGMVSAKDSPSSTVADSLAMVSAPSDPNTSARSRAAADALSVNRIQMMKQRRAVPSNVVDAQLATKLAAEPRLPEVENKQYGWLRDAMSAIPNGLPKIENSQTFCQGRRCEVSGTFASDDDARTWARRYLLVAGGKMLQNSNVVVVPAGDGTGQVQMHLYLH